MNKQTNRHAETDRQTHSSPRGPRHHTERSPWPAHEPAANYSRSRKRAKNFHFKTKRVSGGAVEGEGQAGSTTAAPLDTQRGPASAQHTHARTQTHPPHTHARLAPLCAGSTAPSPAPPPPPRHTNTNTRRANIDTDRFVKATPPPRVWAGLGRGGARTTGLLPVDCRGLASALPCRAAHLLPRA